MATNPAHIHMYRFCDGPLRSLGKLPFLIQEEIRICRKEQKKKSLEDCQSVVDLRTRLASPETYVMKVGWLIIWKLLVLLESQM